MRMQRHKHATAACTLVKDNSPQVAILAAASCVLLRGDVYDRTQQKLAVHVDRTSSWCIMPLTVCEFIKSHKRGLLHV